MPVTSAEPAVEIVTGPTPGFAVIWLHGLGADGHDFEPIVGELDLPVATRFVFPHAPIRPITINNGMPMRAWFDILSIDRAGREDEPAIRASAEFVEHLIRTEVSRGIPRHCIVLAGFSQGGAMALHVGTRSAEPLAGMLALSAFLPLAETFSGEVSSAALPTPVLFMHGLADPVIPMAMAQTARAAVSAAGFLTEWQVYPMQHNVCAAQVKDISKWLGRLAANSRA